MDKITVSKLANGNYLITAPDLKPEGVEYEQAYHVVTQVRESLNYLKLPAEPTPYTKLDASEPAKVLP